MAMLLAPLLAPAMDAGLELGKALGGSYAQDMWDQLNGNEYGDATKSTRAILTAINDMKSNVVQDLRASMLTGQLDDQLSHIETWTTSLADCLLAKHNNEKNADERLADLDKILDNSTNGIAFVLTRIDSILRQTTSISNEGIIKLGCQKLDEALCDPTQVNKDMCWYILEMNRFLATVIRWQTAGLALWLFTARGDTARGGRYLEGWRKKIDGQLDYTYQSYHPMIKSFKFSFWDEIPESRLWRILRPKGPDTFWGWIKDYDAYLIKDGSDNKIFATTTNEPTDPAMHFKFSPTLDKSNAQIESGQWSYLENAEAPGKKVWGRHVVEQYDRARASFWTWQIQSDMPSPWVCPRFKLCPVSKDSRLFKMVAEAEAEYRAVYSIDPKMFWDPAFEAIHVEGSG